MHNITTHFTVRPLLRLSAQIRRYPMVSYAYKAQWSLQNTPPVDWWGISNIRLYTVQITLPATTKRPHSSPEPPPTTALPQNVPMSPLMRLVALRVAAAALDGGRPWWMRQRTFTMLPLFSACVWMRKKCSRVAEPVHSLLQGSIVNREFNPQKSSLFSYLTLFCVYGETTLITCQHLLFFPYHGRCGGQLISGPVALRRLVRSEPLHPHIMGDVICAWFGKKTVGRVVAWFTKSTDDDDDDDDDDIHDNQIGVGEGRQRQWTATITTTTGRAGIRAFGDVFSLCRGMLLQHKQIMNIF